MVARSSSSFLEAACWAEAADRVVGWNTFEDGEKSGLLERTHPECVQRLTQIEAAHRAPENQSGSKAPLLKRYPNIFVLPGGTTASMRAPERTRRAVADLMTHCKQASVLGPFQDKSCVSTTLLYVMMEEKVGLTSRKS